MKKYLMLFFFRIKSAFLSLPKILAATFAFSIIVGLLGFTGTKLLYGDNAVKPMDIALVLPEDSESYTLAAFTFLGEIDTVKTLCSFREMPEKDAFDALRNGRIDAIILIPDKFIEHIMNGTNTPAEVILPTSGGASSSPLFRELVNAGVGDLAVAQAGIYAVDDACVSYGRRSELASAESYLNETYLSYSLNRSAYYKIDTIVSTGSLSLVQFYSCTAIVMLIMFSCLSCIHLLARENKSLTLAFSRKGIPSLILNLSKTFGVSLMFFAVAILAVLCCFAVSAFSQDATGILEIILTDFSFIDIILMFIAIFTTVLTAQTIIEISDNMLAEVVLLFLLTLVMMFLGGAIIPSVLLPEIIQKIGIFMPLTWVFRLWGDVLSDSFNIINVIANIAICCICAALQSRLCKINS